MIKLLQKALIITAIISLTACNGGLKPEKQAQILNTSALNNEQLMLAVNGNSFSANILSGEHAGSYHFKYDVDSTLYIQKSGYSGTRGWSIKDGEICVTTCHKYYKDNATGVLYGTTNGKISSILTPK